MLHVYQKCIVIVGNTSGMINEINSSSHLININNYFLGQSFLTKFVQV